MKNRYSDVKWPLLAVNTNVLKRCNVATEGALSDYFSIKGRGCWNEIQSQTIAFTVSMYPHVYMYMRVHMGIHVCERET